VARIASITVVTR